LILLYRISIANSTHEYLCLLMIGLYEILLIVSRGEFKAGMSGAAPSRSHPCIRHTYECCCYFCCPSSFRAWMR
jgi:hypothetical protein